MRKFFSQLFKNLIEIFSGRNLLWHLAAIALTFILVFSGFDWNFFVYVAGFSKKVIFFPALMFGGILPLLVPLFLLVLGFFLKKRKVIRVSLASAQAAILGIIISSFYKALTGRIQPPGSFHLENFDASLLEDISREFQFGFWRHGVFWGWPSGHTTTAFAMSIAILTMFPKNKIIRSVALIYAFYIGLGVAATSIHWFSEFVAGAIIGWLIGKVVEKSFLKRE